jgi:hypothetical protein
VLFVSGCGSDTTGPAPLAAEQLPWTVQLNHHAVTLSTVSPNDTVQLEVVPRNADGSPLLNGTTVKYRVVNNDTSVALDSSGFVRAHSVKASVLVIASTQVKGMTFLDTARIRVTTDPNPRRLDRIQMTRSAGMAETLHRCNADDAQDPRIPAFAVTAVLQDEFGTPITGLPVRYWSSDPSLLQVNGTNGRLTIPCKAGMDSVKIYASATVYGVRKTDSLTFRLRPPLVTKVLIGQRTVVVNRAPQMEAFFNGATVTIDRGGYVVWFQYPWFPDGLGMTVLPWIPIDVVFDQPEAALGTTDSVYSSGVWIPPSDDSGNISAFAQDTTLSFFSTEALLSRMRVRRFTTPGTYQYRSAIFGTSGKIIVTP